MMSGAEPMAVIGAGSAGASCARALRGTVDAVRAALRQPLAGTISGADPA